MNLEKTWYEVFWNKTKNKTEKQKISKLSIKYWQEGQIKLLTVASLKNNGEQFSSSYKQNNLKSVSVRL